MISIERSPIDKYPGEQTIHVPFGVRPFHVGIECAQAYVYYQTESDYKKGQTEPLKLLVTPATGEVDGFLWHYIGTMTEQCSTVHVWEKRK